MAETVVRLASIIHMSLAAAELRWWMMIHDLCMLIFTLSTAPVLTKLQTVPTW